MRVSPGGAKSGVWTGIPMPTAYAFVQHIRLGAPKVGNDRNRTPQLGSSSAKSLVVVEVAVLVGVWRRGLPAARPEARFLADRSPSLVPRHVAARPSRRPRTRLRAAKTRGSPTPARGLARQERGCRLFEVSLGQDGRGQLA